MRAGVQPRALSMSATQSPALLPRSHVDGKRAAPLAHAMPGRFELIVGACLLLAFASAFSLPLGPGANAPWRGVTTVLASALALALLVAAAAPSRRGDLCLPPRVRRILLAGAFLLAVSSILTFVAWGALQFNAPPSQAYWSDVIGFSDTNTRAVLAGHHPYTNNGAFIATLARFPNAVESSLRRGRHRGQRAVPTRTFADWSWRRARATPI